MLNYHLPCTLMEFYFEEIGHAQKYASGEICVARCIFTLVDEVGNRMLSHAITEPHLRNY